MDSLRAFDEGGDYTALADEEAAIEAPPEIGSDERRMHVRAYNYWVSLLDGRPYPSIRDLDPHRLDDFGPHSVLLDFTEDAEDPKVSFLGRKLREECSLLGDIQRISNVPKRSLLSRLTDHYLQIISNCAPIGFEAEFIGQRGHNTLYRGILMPFSSTGETIDFIYGVINWKELLDSAAVAELSREVDRSLAAGPAASPVWADGPNAEPLAEPISPADQPELELPQPSLGPDAGLADRLSAARDTAETLKAAEGRSRGALYRALGLAYDFALAAEADPEDYAELLEDAGLKAQQRAPMTPIVKLVFGGEYDKARITEYAAALSWARRGNTELGGMQGLVENFEGGLKGIVAAERQARRPESRADAGEAAREALRTAAPIGHVDARADDEFVLLLARRDASGLAVLAPVIADRALVERAIRRAAR